jgi:hypothetical protein
MRSGARISVGIMTGYGLVGRVSIPGRGKISLSSTASQPALRATQPPTQCLPEILPPRVNRPEHEADHLPPSRADVKIEPTPPLLQVLN